jgi:hypothetical protein
VPQPGHMALLSFLGKMTTSLILRMIPWTNPPWDRHRSPQIAPCPPLQLGRQIRWAPPHVCQARARVVTRLFPPRSPRVDLLRRTRPSTPPHRPRRRSPLLHLIRPTASQRRQDLLPSTVQEEEVYMRHPPRYEDKSKPDCSWTDISEVPVCHC